MVRDVSLWVHVPTWFSPRAVSKHPFCSLCNIMLFEFLCVLLLILLCKCGGECGPLFLSTGKLSFAHRQNTCAGKFPSGLSFLLMNQWYIFNEKPLNRNTHKTRSWGDWLRTLRDHG